MKYLHPDNKDLEWRDWRLPENRKEMFFKWLRWRMRWGDLDHYVLNHYYRDATGSKSPTGKPMTKEQQFWFSLIMGTTYRSSMSWVIYWNYPDFWNIDLDEMQKWNVATLENQKYAKDCKYNKGRVAEQVASMQKIIGPKGSIVDFFEELVDDDPHASFERVFNKMMTFHKFGRMTAWITCQNLFEICGLQIKPKTVLATWSSNWSVRTGLMYLHNFQSPNMEKTLYRPTPEEEQWLISAEENLWEESKKHVDKENRSMYTNYLLESHLCQYKKLLVGGDYGGHNTGDAIEMTMLLRDLWPEVNFGCFFEDCNETFHPLTKGRKMIKPFNDLCALTGQVVNMHLDYPELPNMYKELGVSEEQAHQLTKSQMLERIKTYQDAVNGDWLAMQIMEGYYNSL